MNNSSTGLKFNMNISSNLTHHEKNGTCLQEDMILLIFTLWDILDKLVVLATNGGTIIIIYMHRHDMLEIPSNIFITCLTMADLVSVVPLPFRIASTYLSRSWGWTVSCFLTGSFAYIASMINTVTLCVIAVDRLIYVIYPLQYHIKMPVQRAFFISIGIWVFCTLYTLLLFGFGYTDTYDLGMNVRPCRSSMSIQGSLRRLLTIPFAILVPITIGSYIKVGMVALKQKRLIAAAGSTQVQPAGIDFKIAKVMLNVLSAYILCTLVVIALPRIRENESACGVVLRVTYFIWRINTWLNPVIYAWKSQKFRQHVRGIFNRNQVQSSEYDLI